MCTGCPEQSPPRAGGIGASKDRPTVPTPEKSSEGRRAPRGDQDNQLRILVRIRVPGSRRTRPKSSLGVCPFLFPFSYFFSLSSNPLPGLFHSGVPEPPVGIVCDTIGLGPYEALIFLQPFNLLQTIPHRGGGWGFNFKCWLQAKRRGVGARNQIPGGASLGNEIDSRSVSEMIN